MSPLAWIVVGGLSMALIAAGNFIYIGASDLVPEVHRHENLKVSLLLFAAFVLGLALLLVAAVMM